jgi:hypothetical protein
MPFSTVAPALEEVLDDVAQPGAVVVELLAAVPFNGRSVVRGKPETFTFLGFRHICGKARSGAFLLHRQTRRDRMQITLHSIKEKLKERMHEPIAEQGRWLRAVVRGYFAYHAGPRAYDPSRDDW